jgi:hypothetical protein
MTDKAKKSKRAGSSWLVVRETDGLMEKLYSGPERKRARAAAESALADGKGDGVRVMKVSRVTVLDKSDLKAALPQDSF